MVEKDYYLAKALALFLWENKGSRGGVQKRKLVENDQVLAFVTLLL